MRRTAAISGVSAALLFGGLTLQMNRGQDPALGQSGRSSGQSSTGSDATSTSSSSVVDQSDDSGVIAVQQQAPTPTPVQTSTS